MADKPTPEIYAHLCVGGPHDGQCYASRSPKFYVPVRAALSVIPFDSTKPVPATTVKYEDVCYVQCPIHTPDGPVMFWVVEGMSPADLLNTLAKGYKPSPLD